MESGILIGRVWGIPIRLHLSWFVIFFLVAWSLAVAFFPQQYSGLSQPAYWAMGALTSLLFALSVLLHELGHSYLALRNGIGVRSVTLFIFGGVAQIDREPVSPGAEFRIAIAGPLVSFALAGIFGALWLLDRPFPMLAAPSEWLARINFLLAAFNMIPGFPLDGGRVLRAVVWKMTNSLYRATRIAASSGQLVAFGFIGWGIFTMFGGNFFNGLWLVFIGWFLQNAAASSFANINMQQSLRGVIVGQVMNRDLPLIDGRMPVDRLVEENILSGGQRVFLVTDNGSDHLCGMVTLREVTAVPRKDWARTTVGEIMVPCERLVEVHPDTELLTALQKMDSANVAQVPVTEGSQVKGILSREQVLHYIRLRSEIGL